MYIIISAKSIYLISVTTRGLGLVPVAKMVRVG